MIDKLPIHILQCEIGQLFEPAVRACQPSADVECDYRHCSGEMEHFLVSIQTLIFSHKIMSIARVRTGMSPTRSSVTKTTSRSSILT